MGRSVVSRFQVTEYTPARSITIETVESTFPITVIRAVEAIDDARCAVTAEIIGRPRGLLRLIAPLTRRLAQRSVDKDYDRLAALLS